MILTAAVFTTLAGSVAMGPCGSATTSSCETNYTMTAASHPHEKNLVETAQDAGSFDTLIAAAKAAGLVDALVGAGPLTVFAPTDDAFAKLPHGTVENLLKPENKAALQQVLLYHIVAGEAFSTDVVAKREWTTLNGQRITVAPKSDRVLIDSSKLVSTDIEASNGVIHVIDTVMMPELRTIPEVAEAAGSFGTLLAAVNAAGLAETLMGEGPFTVFAPTDEAFSALGSTVNDLLKPENLHTLRDILLYHVVPGRVFASEVVNLNSATAANEKSLTIGTRDGQVMIDGVHIIQTDIDAGNGVIHVIDGVLIPE